MENSCEAMHEILDAPNQHSRASKNSPPYLDSDLNIEGKMIFHKFHKRKWKMCVDSSRTKIFRMRRISSDGGIPTNIQLGPNHKIRIEAIDCLDCMLGSYPSIPERRDFGAGSLVKKDEFIY